MLQNPWRQHNIYLNYHLAAAVVVAAAHPAAAAAAPILKTMQVWRYQPKRKESLLWSVQQTRKQIEKMVHVCAKSVNLKEREKQQRGMLLSHVEVDSL